MDSRLKEAISAYKDNQEDGIEMLKAFIQDTGNVNAMKLLSSWIQSFDMEYCLELWRECGNMGDADCLLMLCQHYEKLNCESNNSNNEENPSLEYLIKAAELHDSRAVIKLSRYYQTIQFEPEYLECIKKAAQLGCPYSIKYLTTMETGQEKLNSLVKAGNNGLKECYFEAANLLFHGIGLERNVLLAMEYLLKAVNSSTMPSVVQVGSWYMGNEVNQLDYSKAFECFANGCKEGDPNAFKLMGDCYSNGFGCEMDHELAQEYYQKAIDTGNRDAILAMLKLNLRRNKKACKALASDYIATIVGLEGISDEMVHHFLDNLQAQE